MNKINEINSQNNQQERVVVVQSKTQNLSATGTEREIETLNKLKLGIVDKLQTDNFLNCSWATDLHKYFFERCMETMADGTDQSQNLVRLRRVNKYLNEQIDGFISEYIKAEYQPNDIIPFSIFQNTAENVSFPPCLNVSLNKALMLHLNALNNPKKLECKAYSKLFEFQVKNWTTACSNSKFTYEVKNVKIEKIKKTEFTITIGERLVNLYYNKPSEIYLVSQFLEEYIISEQFIGDCAVGEKQQKLCDLLLTLNYYQSYEGIDVIKRSLVHKLKQYIDGGKLNKISGLCIFSWLLEHRLLSAQKYLSVLIPLGLENVNNIDWCVKRNAFWLILGLVDNGIMISEEDCKKLLPSAIENVNHYVLTVREYALELLAGFVKKGMIISQDDLNLLLALAININNAQSEVQLSALVLLNALISKGIKVQKDHLNKFLPIVIKDAGNAEEKVQFVQSHSLNILILLVNKCIIPEEDLKKLLPLAFSNVNHKQAWVSWNALGLLHELLIHGVIIPEVGIKQLLPLVINKVNYKGDFRVRMDALSLLRDLVKQGIAISEEHLNQLLPLVMKNIHSSFLPLQTKCLLLLCMLVSKGFIQESNYEKLKDLALKNIKEDRLPRMPFCEGRHPCTFSLNVHIGWQVKAAASILLSQVFLSQRLAKETKFNLPVNLLRSIHMALKALSAAGKEKSEVEIEIFSLLIPFCLSLQSHSNSELAEIAREMSLLLNKFIE